MNLSLNFYLKLNQKINNGLEINIYHLLISVGSKFLKTSYGWTFTPKSLFYLFKMAGRGSRPYWDWLMFTKVGYGITWFWLIRFKYLTLAAAIYWFSLVFLIQKIIKNKIEVKKTNPTGKPMANPKTASVERPE